MSDGKIDDIRSGAFGDEVKELLSSLINASLELQGNFVGLAERVNLASVKLGFSSDEEDLRKGKNLESARELFIALGKQAEALRAMIVFAKSFL